MTEKDFFSLYQVREGVKLPWFRAKRRINITAETGRRIRALGGTIPAVSFYNTWRFFDNIAIVQRDFGKLPYKYTDAHTIHRDSINKLKLLQKEGKVI